LSDDISMATNLDNGRLRSYLLGGLPEEQSTALEETYLRDEETLESLQAAEYELIDDYLDGRLTPDERERFDRHYLASPVHRHRLATARRLRSAAAPTEPAREATPRRTTQVAPFARRWFEWPIGLRVALAAGLVLALALTALWLSRMRPAAPRVEPTLATNPAGATTPAQPDVPTPNVPPPSSAAAFAISLSPAGVRSADDTQPATIPPDADRVIVHLESDGASHPFAKGRAVVRTVSGRDAWSGPAIAEPSAPAPVYARVEIPADRLPPDDYIVTVFETRENGVERERFRYFLRIRAR
jgi:hypothetical protein